MAEPGLGSGLGPFKVDETVLTYHGKLLYQAKILQSVDATTPHYKSSQTGWHYFIHYQGWNKNWDEWVHHTALFKRTPENETLRRQLMDGHRQDQQRQRDKEKDKERPEKERKRKDLSVEPGRRSHATTPLPTAVSASMPITTGAHVQPARPVRQHEMADEYGSGLEIQIKIPDEFVELLVDDWENLTWKDLLVPLPRTPSVYDLLEAYEIVRSKGEDSKGEVDHSETRKTDDSKDVQSSEFKTRLQTILSSLKDYFDAALPRHLLYRAAERKQYMDQLKTWVPGTQPGQIYGAEHLLRLLCTLGKWLAFTTIEQNAVVELQDEIAKLYEWMWAQRKVLFVKEYVSANLHALRLAA